MQRDKTVIAQMFDQMFWQRTMTQFPRDTEPQSSITVDQKIRAN
jgi:hypothetical protein